MRGLYRTIVAADGKRKAGACGRPTIWPRRSDGAGAIGARERKTQHLRHRQVLPMHSAEQHL